MAIWADRRVLYVFLYSIDTRGILTQSIVAFSEDRVQ